MLPLARRSNLNRHKGFTLIEVMISLAILSLSLLIIYPMCQKSLETFEFNRVLSTFRDDISLVRQHNMLTPKTPWQLKIDATATRYEIKASVGNQLILSRTLPKGFHFSTGNRVHIITFNTSGNINRAHTLPVLGPNQQANIVFSVGLGGMDIRVQ